MNERFDLKFRARGSSDSPFKYIPTKSLNFMELAQRVHTNLVHYNQWNDVAIELTLMGPVLRGTPPDKLDGRDDLILQEWVVPKQVTDQTVSVTQINQWFEAIATVAKLRPARVTMAIEGADGTIVYYFVHDGVTKPRQN